MTTDLTGILSWQVLLFLLFGAGALVTAIVMVLYPNPVRSALMLVLNLFCVAVLYLLLNAYFLAAVQVIVYAGAIMVLFLFVIMLLNLGAPDRAADRLKWQQPVAVVVGLIVAAVFSLVIFASVPAKPYVKPKGATDLPMVAAPAASRGLAPGAPEASDAGATGAPGVVVVMPGKTADPDLADPERAGTVEGIGYALFNPALPWLFPFEITSFLLLIAVIGSVVLAKRRLPGEQERFTEAITTLPETESGGGQQ